MISSYCVADRLKVSESTSLKSKNIRTQQPIVKVDDKLTLLNLSSEEFQPFSSTLQEKEERLAKKPPSNRWLMDGGLSTETEGFMVRIEDEVIATRNFKKHIIKDPNTTEDRCRRCGLPGETIDHIISACPTLTQSDYLNILLIIHGVPTS